MGGTLTLILSLRERKVNLHRGSTEADFRFETLPGESAGILALKLGNTFPLPEGEDKGEGQRMTRLVAVPARACLQPN
jgi:hypothetical protein